jgi:hypothetical protein
MEIYGIYGDFSKTRNLWELQRISYKAPRFQLTFGSVDVMKLEFLILIRRLWTSREAHL